MPAPGVLGNDIDVDGDTLSAVLVAGPGVGTLTLAAGSFTYTPPTGFSGPVSFTYQASDGALTSTTATVTITVAGVNDPPVAADDSYSTNEDTPLTVAAPGVLGNDTDADGDPLTAQLVTAPTLGTLTLNPDGSFTYTPTANASGTDSFTYNASDGPSSDTATVTITVTPVNDPPLALADSYGTTEDTALTVPAPGVLGNDFDIDSGTLTASLVTGPTAGTPDPERGRLVHLHAARRLQRPGQLHLPGERRGADQRDSHRHDHGRSRGRSARCSRRRATRRRGLRRERDRRARQRHRRRRRRR